MGARASACVSLGSRRVPTHDGGPPVRLWVRLVLLMGVITLVPVGVLGWLAWGLATESASSREEDALTREAATLATFVGAWVDAQGRTLAGWHRVWDLDERDDGYRLGLVRATWRAMEPAVVVALVDGAGDPVVPPQYLPPDRVPPGRVPGSPSRARALLEHLPDASPTGIAIGRPYTPPGALEPSVALLAGRPHEELRLAAEISLDTIARLVRGGRGNAIVLLDDVQRPVLGDLTVLAAVGGLEDVAALGPEVAFTSSPGQAGFRGATARVPTTGWSVAVVAAGAAAADVGGAIRDTAVIVAGVVVLVIALVGLVVDRTLTAAIVQLIEHARAIRDGDYASRSAVVRGDELGELARAFDEMAGRLEAGRADLQRANEELEGFNRALQDRVDARTRDLREAQDRLVQAAQVEAVAEVGAGLAHELNNPLAAILGQIELLRARGGGDDAALARVEQAARRCRDVVATMQGLVSGHMDASRAPVVDLCGVLREVVADVRETFDQRGVRVDDLLGASALPVRAERAVLQRGLRTFLESLAMALGGEGVVRLERVDDGIDVVTDPPVREGRGADDWRAGSVRIWGARRLAELSGVALAPRGADGRTWRLVAAEAR